ncbi:MAG TPA: carboxypeptidase M32 [Actinomycetota bacterium]|jgi:carboxypeptidase Taq|nr:carboxypeptidase M32 [Actinomycetota bacterium]
MPSAWERLLPRLYELRDLHGTLALLHWDQAVMMPPSGGEARARMISTVEAIAHNRLVDPEIGDLLAELRDDGGLDEVTAAHVRVLARDYDRAVKIPERLVREIAEESGLAYQTWTKARPEDDFPAMRPHLERLVALKKEEADAVGFEGERYDALLDIFEPGMRTVDVEKMFGDLVAGLRPVADAILESTGPRPSFLSAAYEEDRQMRFCQWLVAQIGFDGDAGRLDLSPHPFTTTISPGDIRQTTRTDRNSALEAVFAALHETGHALYEQGIPQDLLGLPAGNAPSLGIHESQSRMWENQVGRSRPFCDFLLPKLKDQFPEELGNVSPDEFHRGANFPARSLIRVHADELTYNLHVALRFELEVALFRDELEVADLPGAWNDGMERNVGVRPSSDSQGVLQDMHWSGGAFGYFPTYTLGTMYSAAFFRRAEEDLGDLSQDLRKGDGARLLGWLRENIHRKAYVLPAAELGESVLGGPLSAEPLLDYLRDKYTAIFDVSL